MSLPVLTNLTGSDDYRNTTEDGLTSTPNLTRFGCDISTKYGIVKCFVAVVCFIFGVLYTFLGYRFFKAIMFLTGFIFGAVLTYMIIEEQHILPTEGILGCAAGAGILLGLVTMLIHHIGLFLTGFNLGVAAAAGILVVVEQFTHPEIKWIPIGVFLTLGIILGILNLRFQKFLTIISTSVFGAALGLAAIDYFVELGRMTQYMWDRVKAARSQEQCWYGWLMLFLWPATALLGAVIQWRFTSVGVEHKLALRSRREQGASIQQTRARDKRETQQTRYRHLYQARRVKGDVISQNFIQSIQSKLSPSTRSVTAAAAEPSNEEESTATTTLTHLT